MPSKQTPTEQAVAEVAAAEEALRYAAVEACKGSRRLGPSTRGLKLSLV